MLGSNRVWLKSRGHERKRASIRFGLPRRGSVWTFCLEVMLWGAMSGIGAQQRLFPAVVVMVVSDLLRG